jgi:hypothetical protein
MHFGLLKKHLGSHQFYEKKDMKMAVHEWLHVQKPTSTTAEHLNLRQDGANSSVCLGIMLKNKRATSDTTMAFPLFLMALGKNRVEHHSCSRTSEGNTRSCTFSYSVNIPASRCHISARSAPTIPDYLTVKLPDAVHSCYRHGMVTVRLTQE